jgi:SAM-dependent methyltransferase
MRRYSRSFYDRIRDGSRQSARELVPLLLKCFSPRTVIDVGCGVGTWVSVFRELGVEEVWGVDGPWVDRGLLEIPQNRFVTFDLTKPFRMNVQFDLVLALEVAEHLPKDCGPTFVDSVTRLGPLVVFSAAIPFQGGDRHVNEQWPEYWATLFNKGGYVVVDCIRKLIWNNPKVEWWYSQNALLYVRRDVLEHNEFLRREFDGTCASQLSIVHPTKYLSVSDPRRLALRLLASRVPLALWYKCGHRVEALFSRMKQVWRGLAKHFPFGAHRAQRNAGRRRDRRDGAAN